jgi:DNA-binding GntR family transcriptional regulator
VERATASQLDELDQWLLVCEEDVARNDSNSYFWHSLAARNAEALFSGSPELHRVVRSLGLRTLQLRHLSLSQPGRSAASLERHRALNAAYHARDVEVARESTVDLITSGYIAIEGSMLAGDETSSGSAEDDDSTGGSRLPDPTISRLMFGQGGPHLLQTSTERSG